MRTLDMRKPGLLRKSIGITVALALTAVLVRCSPLSLSQSKMRLQSGASGTSPINVPNSGNPGGPQLGPSHHGSSFASVPSSIHDLTVYQSEIDAIPSEQRLSLSHESAPDAIEAFRNTRTLYLHFEGHAPERCRVYLGLSLSETVIAGYGWNSPANAVTTDCVPQQDGVWKVSISPSIAEDTWAAIAPRLEALTVFVATSSRIAVVPASQPAPSRSPSPGVHVE